MFGDEFCDFRPDSVAYELSCGSADEAVDIMSTYCN